MVIVGAIKPVVFNAGALVVTMKASAPAGRTIGTRFNQLRHWQTM
jgi:hypothetical protein